jgi:hypothetical protein
MSFDAYVSFRRLREEAIRASGYGQTSAMGNDVQALEWIPGEPVEIRVRKRGAWTELDDDGEAIRRAGRPPGWYEVADQVAAAEGMNVQRATGRVFVAYGRRSGHDDAEIRRRLAETALGVYQAVLDLE